LKMAKSIRLFASDLSNYNDIRKGLTSKMRDQIPTRAQLMKATPDVRQNMIDTLNEWRQLSQKEKVKFQERAGTDYVKVYKEESEDLYFTESERVEFATASLKLRMMTPDQAEWEMKESLNAVDRKHTKDFYKAMSYIEDDIFDEAQASDEMLSEIIKDGGMSLETKSKDGKKTISHKDIFERALKEYLDRKYGAMNMSRVKKSEMYWEEYADKMASYHQDLLSAARLINA